MINIRYIFGFDHQMNITYNSKTAKRAHDVFCAYSVNNARSYCFCWLKITFLLLQLLLLLLLWLSLSELTAAVVVVVVAAAAVCVCRLCHTHIVFQMYAWRWTCFRALTISLRLTHGWLRWSFRSYRLARWPFRADSFVAGLLCVCFFFSLFFFHFQNIFVYSIAGAFSQRKIFSVHKYCNNKLYAFVYTSTLGMIIVSLLHSQFTCFIVFCVVFSRISDCLCAQFLCIHSCVLFLSFQLYIFRFFFKVRCVLAPLFFVCISRPKLIMPP